MTGSLQNLSGLDRVIHEPARLMLVALLSSVESADFLFLLKESDLTKGNLSVHLSRLEEAGYVQAEKTFRGKIPHTEYRLTSKENINPLESAIASIFRFMLFFYFRLKSCSTPGLISCKGCDNFSSEAPCPSR